ncbi:MAG: CHAT domain-containing protein [Cytophagaceae bacterium]|nr:CHAT domain-containing protein [Cytophagaceae bacterium]
MKLNIFLLLTLLVWVSNKSFGQFDPKKIVGNVNTRDGLTKLKGAMLTKMTEARKEYDEASFNYAVALSDNAGLYETEERYKKQQKIFLEVVKSTDSEANTPLDKASNYNDLGEMLYANNHFTAAEVSFKKAIRIYEGQSETKHPIYALTLSNLGLLYHTTGRYMLAEKFTQTALDLRKEIFTENNAAYAASVNNLAVLYKEMGKYNESEQLINQAIRINEQTVGKNSVPYALSLNNQAMLYQIIGRYNMAEPVLQQAIDIAGQTLKEKSTNYVRLMVNLALLCQDMKKYPEAEAIYNKAIRIKEGKLGTNHPDYAHLLNNLAALYMLMNKYDQVESLLKRSADIYKRQFGEKHPSYASAISNLGNFYRVSNRNAEAEPLLKQVADIRKEALGEEHPEYINSIESLGLLYWQTGRMSEASQSLKQVLNKNIEHIHHYFAPMSEAEKAKFWEKIRPKFQRFNSFVMDAQKSDPSLTGDLYNYQLATKALLLNATNKVKQQILNSGDKDLISEYLAWLDEKENLARLYTLSKEELATEKIKIDSLEKVANDREKKLSAKSKEFQQEYDTSDDITYQSIREKLEVNEAAIEIIQFYKFNKVFTDTVIYAVLILTKENSAAPVMVILDNGKQLEKKYYNLYKNSIKQKIKDETSYAQYWSKIDKEVATKKNLFVSLDGIYNQINLNTLLTPQGTFLVDSKNIRVVTNSKEILKIKTAKPSSLTNNATLIGFPDYGPAGSIVKLPGTKAEIEAIKPILTTGKYTSKVLMQADASEQNIKSVKSPKILHIATHGFFQPEPDEASDEKVFGIESTKAKENPLLRSGLMVAGAEAAVEGKSENGILTAYEVMNMQLDNTEIVVLSACETGLGDVKNGEGVYGLQRAFQVAGAKAIIMSLWKVNDEATKQLMTSFYKYYSLSGSKQDAFKKAQVELKTKFKDPYFWGAFVLVE